VVKEPIESGQGLGSYEGAGIVIFVSHKIRSVELLI
jgi:hypothetical protein